MAFAVVCSCILCDVMSVGTHVFAAIPGEGRGLVICSSGVRGNSSSGVRGNSSSGGLAGFYSAARTVP